MANKNGNLGLLLIEKGWIKYESTHGTRWDL